MFNLEQIQNRLQSPSVTDQHLIFYVQNPNGQVPSVLALAELKRRQELRTSKTPQEQAQNVMQPTVADKVIAQDTQANIGPDFRSQGLPAIDQQAQAQRSMGQGISDLTLPETMYDEKNYAGGGIVAFADGGETSMNLDELPTLNVNTGEQSYANRMAEERQMNPLGQMIYGLTSMGSLKPTIGKDKQTQDFFYSPHIQYGTDPQTQQFRKLIETGRMAQGGAVAFDNGGDVDLRTMAQFTPAVRQTNPLSNEEEEIMKARYLLGADFGNSKASVGANYAGNIDAQGIANPRLNEVQGRYMTDQGDQYSARYNPDARYVGLDRQSGRTSVGADVAPGPDNSMGLRSIRGSYITDNGTRYGAGYNVDTRQALLNQIDKEGNSLGLNVSRDGFGVQGQYGFAQGGEVKHYVGGSLVQSDAPAEDLSGLSLSDLTPEQYSRLTTEQLAALQQIEGDRQRLGRLGKGALGAVTAPYQIGAYGLEKIANAVGVPRIGKALGIYDPDVKSVRMPRVGISDLTKPLDVSKEALAKVVAENAKDKKPAPKPETEKEAPKSKKLPAEAGFTGIQSEKIKGLGEYAKELEDYVGPDKSREGRDARMAKMETRAKDMEDKNVGMSMLTAGLDILGGTSPYAAVNLARGKSGVEQYQKTADKLAELEEKRYALITDAERADRQEKLAFAKYGADAKQTKEAQAHAEKLQNNLLKNQWSIAKYNNDIELIKAQSKGGMDANQIFTAKQKLLDTDDYAQWQAAMVDEFGKSVLNTPDFAKAKEKWLNDTLGIRATTSPVAANTSGYTITPSK
jgi:hypothetical protein